MTIEQDKALLEYFKAVKRMTTTERGQDPEILDRAIEVFTPKSAYVFVNLYRTGVNSFRHQHTYPSAQDAIDNAKPKAVATGVRIELPINE